MDHDKRGMRIPVSGGAVAPAPGAAIRFDAVVRRQGAFTLGPLDMSVPNGLVAGFVGPNGAGKTTAIKAMLGMVGIDAGSISLLGAAPRSRHDRIGVVLDTVALPPEWTAVSAARNLGRFYPGWDQDLFGELLARLEVLDVFRDFLVEEGRTILFSTHITSDLERIADCLHIIAAGRTCFAGPLHDLTEQWAMVRGPLSALSPEAEAVLTGTRRSDAGTFSGLIRVSETAAFGPDVVIEPPSIDEAVAAMTRGSRSAGSRPHARPAAPAVSAQEN